MDWWTVIKSHPRLVELLGNSSEKLVKLADEEEMIELWNASNPELQIDSRASLGIAKTYPIDTWYGLIKKINEKPVLGVIGGYALRSGKNGKKFAYIGGIRNNRTRDFQGPPTQKLRDHYFSKLQGIPKIAGYTENGWRRFGQNANQPETHEIIPDEVLNFFRTSSRYDNRWSIQKNYDWGVWV